MTMNLQDYRNDLFAKRSTMLDALNYVNTLCSAASTPSDSVAMRTAVHTVLNTAIELHKAELQALRSQLATRLDPVTALLALVDERVNAALEKLDIDSRVDNFLTHNLSDKVTDAIDLDDKVQEQIAEYFSSNTFSIDRR